MTQAEWEASNWSIEDRERATSYVAQLDDETLRRWSQQIKEGQPKFITSVTNSQWLNVSELVLEAYEHRELTELMGEQEETPKPEHHRQKAKQEQARTKNPMWGVFG